MAQTGKKINQLEQMSTLTDQTVLPGVYVSSGVANTTANKITVAQLSSKVQNDMSSALSAKQDKLTAGDNITISEQNVISSTADSLPDQAGNSGKFLTTDGTTASWDTIPVPQNVWTQDNLISGNNIQITQLANTTTATLSNYAGYIDALSNTYMQQLAQSENWSIRVIFKYTSNIYSNSYRIIMRPSYDESGSTPSWVQGLELSINSGVLGAYVGQYNDRFIDAQSVYTFSSQDINKIFDLVLRFTGTAYYLDIRQITDANYTTILLGQTTKKFTWNSNASLRLLNPKNYDSPYSGTLYWTYFKIIADNTTLIDGTTTSIQDVTKTHITVSQEFIPIYSSENPYSINLDLTNVSGYSSSGTQVLKNINGVLTWVTES